MTTPGFDVLRLCSVFEPAPGSLTPEAVALDPIGGMQTHTAELTRSLDRVGVPQTVVTARLAAPPGRTPFGRHASVVRVGARVRRPRQLWALGAARWALAGPAPGVVHAHQGEDLAVLPLAVLAARRARCPLVVTLHCSLAHTLRVTGARSALLRTVGAVVERRVVARADAVIALTERTARAATECGAPADRVWVIPSGVQPQRFAGPVADPFPDLARPRVAYVGRLAAQKGVATLVDAVPRLVAAAAVIVVGDGPQRAALEARARRLRAGPPVRFTGFVPHGVVPSVLRHADVVVLPSRYEELGSVLLEAMQAGTPVVASDVGGIPEVVVHGHTGLLVPPDDPAALAAAVDLILRDAPLRRRFGEAAKRRVGRYAWDGLARDVLAVYTEARRRQPGRRARRAR